MLPLVHNTIIRNRCNTLPSSSARSQSTTTISASDASVSQYGVQLSSRDEKSRVAATTNTPSSRHSFFKNRSLTFGSFFPSRSRSTSTNSLQSSMIVDETLASVLRPIQLSEFLNESRTVSELNLNRPNSSNQLSNNRNSSLFRTSSTSSDLNDEKTLLDNLVNDSLGSDLNNTSPSNSHSNSRLNSRSSSRSNSRSTIDRQSSNELTELSTTPSFPPPSYTPIDPNRNRRSFLLTRSQSAPQQCRSSGNDLFFSNSIILENIQEISNNSQTQLTDVVEEDEEQLDMASRRNSYLNHRFNCRLAHEKQTVTIGGFNTKEELYERISNAFNIEINKILYCTLNSPSIANLFDRHINFDDVIYVHLKGKAKEIEIEKTVSLLGLTICDNSNGLCLIKKIKEGSVIDKMKFINVGDIIEKINNINLIGYRHIDVSNMLKAIPVGEIFVIRLIEPQRDTDDSSNSNLPLSKLKNKIKKGYETLRIRSKQGLAVFEEDDETIQDNAINEKINAILEEFIGISDSELAQQIHDIGKRCNRCTDFVIAINESDLKMFNFNNDMITEVWMVINTDQKES